MPPNKPKPLPKNPWVSMPKPVKLPKVEPVRVPRGPTVRWDINYNNLFKKKGRK